jgi:hypothetical protein
VDFVEYDLGQIASGSTVVVSLDTQANVLLLDQSNLSKYKRRDRVTFYGGLAEQSPVRIEVPRSGHWYVAIDLGGGSGNIRSSVEVEPPLP